MVATDADIAWLAGIIEGEGCISIGPKIVRIAVGMTDRDIVERLDRLFPCPNGVVVKEFSNHYKTRYLWRIGKTEQVREILTLILPWLGQRRAGKATEALAFLDARPGPHQRKDRCKQGHFFTPENTYVDAAGYSNCRTCRTAWAREARERKGPGWIWRGEPRVCEFCGAEFRPSRPEQRTCDRACGSKLRWQRARLTAQ